MRRTGDIFATALIVAIAVTTLWAATADHRTFTVYLPIDYDGDTAQVMAFAPSTVMDSFAYVDTIVTAGGTDSAEIAWTSPLQQMAITIDTDSVYDSGVYLDTFILPGTSRLGVAWTSPLYQITVTPSSAVDGMTYACTVQLAADTFAVEWTAPGSGTDIAMVCDSMVAAINGTADLTDTVTAADGTTAYTLTNIFGSLNVADFTVETDTASSDAITANTTVAMWADSITAAINAESDLTDFVTASDSATYVLVASNFGTETMGGRWTVKASAQQDTSTGGRVMTAGMWADTLVAAINAGTCADYVTATDDDTGFTLTSDRKGWAFTIYFGDTATDTSTTQANVTSNSTTVDTVMVHSLMTPYGHYTSIDARLIVGAADDTVKGIGDSDSCVVLWLTRAFGDQYSVLDADTSAAIPCTSAYILQDSAGNDTLLKQNLMVVVYISDTATDTSFMSITYDCELDYTLKEK